MVDCGACSACHGAMIQFFRYHHQEYLEGPKTTLVFGADATDADCQEEGRLVLVGNCTAKLCKEGRAFCKGCPPVPSQIARTIDAGVTLDD